MTHDEVIARIGIGRLAELGVAADTRRRSPPPRASAASIVAVVPSSAVARTMAVPAVERMHHAVLLDVRDRRRLRAHMKVVGIVALVESRSVANSWSSNPTGSAGSLGDAAA